MNKIIAKLNQIGKNYIDENFNLIQKDTFGFVISGKNISIAVNQKKNDSQIVNVLNWFNEFWVYIEIRMVPKGIKNKRKIPNIFFSLSVFQGEFSDEIKVQLFRAEWDNYEELLERHPQPHWHIYTQRDIEDTSKTFEIKETEDDNFEKYIEREKKVVNIARFHFAMNGQWWSESKTDVHKIEIDSNLTDWFEGVLNHIKKELEYIEVK